MIKERGGWLTAWLSLLLVLGALGALLPLTSKTETFGALLSYMVLPALSIIALIFIFQWKKWALYSYFGLYFLYILGFIVLATTNFKLTDPILYGNSMILYMVYLIVPLGVFAFLIRNKLKLFE